jgi:two-component system LytT family sensor kinase
MKKLINNRWFLIAMPFVIWFLVLILPFLASTDSNNNFFPDGAHRRWILNIISANALLLCVFYLHTYLVYPLINKKVVWYVVGLTVLLALYWFCWHLLRGEPQQGRVFIFRRGEGGGMRLADSLRMHLPDSLRLHPPGDGAMRPPNFRGGGPRDLRIRNMNGLNFFPLISPMVAILCSICYRVILDNRVRMQMLKERETAHLKSELTFLRSQISPHFMFNILNNLVALASKKSDDLEPAIVNLSQLMRYMLYESDDHRVSLGKEIEYLKSYINLQMLRFGTTMKVNIDVKGNPDLYTIEPMLLIPFVENAFKHGTGMVDNPVIDISIAIDDATNLMRFIVVNGIGDNDLSKDGSSGIGIANVKRRLAILHPGKHELNIVNNDNSFTVDLSIYLSN